MKRLLTVLSFLTVLLASNAAFALDMEYYTYGGFEQIVGAFTKIALIFSDSGFMAAVFVAMAGGILFGHRHRNGGGRAVLHDRGESPSWRAILSMWP